MSFSTESPFKGHIPNTVPLKNTPLTGVVFQVRFPEIFSISKRDFIADFQEKIRSDFPIAKLDKTLTLQITSEGPVPSEQPHWRFLDSSQQWRLSLATNFMALETRAYQSRSDLIERIFAAVSSLEKTINPSVISRIGMRYTDRIHGDQLKMLSSFIRPEILGISVNEHQEHIVLTSSELNAQTDAGSMIARWGYLQPNHTHDSDMMPPISVPSWFLDTDIFLDFPAPESFKAESIKTTAQKLADRSYGFFRWVVSDELLRAYGGEI